jgi:hypothetical protein
VDSAPSRPNRCCRKKSSATATTTCPDPAQSSTAGRTVYSW